MIHADDCDGYAFAHFGEVRRFPGVTARAAMRQAACRECPWEGSRVGPGAFDLADREAREHSEEVRCSGQCTGRSA
jgi:hypothetical protein